MTTGRVAAETIVRLKRTREPMIEANLIQYQQALEKTFVLKDLKKYKDIPSFLHNNKHFFSLYPKLLSKAAQTMLRVDGKDKISKEKEIMTSFRVERTFWGLIGDAFKLARAWR